MAFYLSPYILHHFQVPLGWDTPGYVWRTNLAGARGAAALPANIPAPGPVNPGRPGFVVLAAMLGAALRSGTFRLAQVMPAVMAAAAGSAAGVPIVALLRRPPWQLAALAVGVGTSVFAVHAINVEAYQDNIIAVAVFLAAVTPIMLSLRHRSAVVPAVLLLGACGVIHWNVFEFALGVVLLTLLVYVPSSVRRWRRGQSAVDTPSGRLAQIAVGGTAVTLGSILGMLTARLPSADLVAGQFADKLRRDLPDYHLAFTVALSGAGAVSLASFASDESEERLQARPLLLFMLAWCEVALAGFLAERLFGWAVPTHRLLADTMALPIFGMLAVLWGAELAATAWKPLAAVVVVVALAGSALVAFRQWSRFRPVMSRDRLTQAAAAGRYLSAARISPSRPVVFIVDDLTNGAWSSTWLTAHTIRSMLPPGLVATTYFYFGTPQGYLSARPTAPPALGPTGSPASMRAATYRSLSDFYFVDVERTYRMDPVALVMASADSGYAAWATAHPATVVGPEVAVVRGAVMNRAPRVPTVSIVASGGLALAALSLGVLAVLILTGAGWSLALMGRWLGLLEVVALAPAVGTALLVVGGVLLNGVGLPLHGAGAITMVAAIAAAGWAVAIASRRGRSRARET